MPARHLGATTGQSRQMSRASRRAIRTPRHHELIVRIPRVDSKNVLGLAYKIIGLQKEIVGRERLIRSGRSSSTGAPSASRSCRRKVKADGHKAKAAAADTP